MSPLKIDTRKKNPRCPQLWPACNYLPRLLRRQKMMNALSWYEVIKFGALYSSAVNLSIGGRLYLVDYAIEKSQAS